MCFTRTQRTAEESAFCKRACNISCRRVTGSTAEGLDFSNARALPLADYHRRPYTQCVVVVVDIIYIYLGIRILYIRVHYTHYRGWLE